MFRRYLAAAIDTLPSEIKTAVLYVIPDLASLKALVHATPSFHAVHLSQRKQLLSTALERCLQLPVMVDAVAALIASGGREKRSRAPKRSQEALTEDDLLETARLHKIVGSILKDMVLSFLKFRPGTRQLKEEHDFLSPLESFRLRRALYRLEIYRLLFNNYKLPHLVEVDFSQNHLDSDDQWELFLSIFSPWEMEESRCVQMYIFRVYEELPGATALDDRSELFPEENKDPLTPSPEL
ncbi:uncharacterized protein BDW43DRAFT_319652 [Aspergillus alliaceus]|uniref:uncharacterized protein n=1 Tax=Petromyces alliaceus TaxID=209559 RepID=UPI0012A6AB26|nr:uncharacterized protein BDW43DRAFT_319652 [Aspergillus alliaceus]KAB8233374.1 hypothetical protein BDW43DRAFT_319652 [Aspergillus alliaceus]